MLNIERTLADLHEEIKNVPNNGDTLREAEISNLRDCVAMAQSCYLEGDTCSLEIVMEVAATVRERINWLLNNPSHAGAQEKYRDTIPCPQST
jgi:hypothetical protein